MSHHYAAMLKGAGLKVTPARKQILEIFSDDCKPVNAEYIYEKIKSATGKAGAKINQVTVYRTLASLEEKGILKRVDLHKDSVYYELADHHHHHIICTACGLIEGFGACNIESLSKKALGSSSKFSTVNDHSIELFGVCRSCVRKIS